MTEQPEQVLPEQEISAGSNRKEHRPKEPLVFRWFLDAQDQARAAVGVFNEKYRFKARIDPKDRLETISENRSKRNVMRGSSVSPSKIKK